MATSYHGDPQDVISAANDGYLMHGELEGYLSTWLGLKDDFQGAVNGSQTGTAIQTAMQGAFDSGKKLAATMQQIMDTLKDTGVKVDGMDLEAASQVKFNDGVSSQGLGGDTQALGANGKLDLGF